MESDKLARTVVLEVLNTITLNTEYLTVLFAG